MNLTHSEVATPATVIDPLVGRRRACHGTDPERVQSRWGPSEGTSPVAAFGKPSNVTHQPVPEGKPISPNVTGYPGGTGGGQGEGVRYRWILSPASRRRSGCLPREANWQRSAGHGDRKGDRSRWNLEPDCAAAGAVRDAGEATVQCGPSGRCRRKEPGKSWSWKVMDTPRAEPETHGSGDGAAWYHNRPDQDEYARWALRTRPSSRRASRIPPKLADQLAAEGSPVSVKVTG